MTQEQLNRKLFSLGNKVENILPSQKGNSGKVLSTDGTNPLWITSSSAGIADGSITNTKLANVATATFKGRASSGTGVPQDLTVAQVKVLLNLSNTNSGDQDISGIAINATAIGTLSALATSDKTNLVAALNEVKIIADTAAGGGTIVGDGTVTNAKLATDVKIGSLAALTTTAKSSVVSSINELNSAKAYASTVGSLSSLTTTAKSNVVAAINEVQAGKQIAGDYATASALATAISTEVTNRNAAIAEATVTGIDKSFELISYASSLSIAYDEVRPNKKIGILTGNIAITSTGASNGSSGFYLVSQDGTGSRAVTVEGQSIIVNPAASSSTLIGWMYDGINFYIESSFSS